MSKLYDDFNEIVNSTVSQQEKIELLLSSIICNELISNDDYVNEMIKLCFENLCILNKSIEANMYMYDVINGSKQNNYNSVVVEFLKDRDRLSNQIDKSKKLTSDLQKNKFKTDLKCILDDRRVF